MKRLITFLTASALLLTSGLSASAAAPLEYTDTGDVDVGIFTEAEPAAATAADIAIAAPSAILMEKETGTVIYEKDADTQMEPASVTKVMTILLIVEALENGLISADDIVTASAYACSMGGSQIFLKEGEQMTVHDMLKSIVVASANDAAVAMAEHLCGTETAFVAKMNARAAELGMENTVFKNCTGLLDDRSHVTTARDIAVMSRELIRHDMIKDYTTIWMDTVRDGTFGLSNTNKLIYYYDGATGLKTGFTQESMYCLAATAQRDGVEYIAVVMHAETSSDRFESAKTLLSYGFANYTLITAAPDDVLTPLPVAYGQTDCVQPVLAGTEKLLVKKTAAANITKQVDLAPALTAPITAGQQIGTLTVADGASVLGTYPILAGDSIPHVTWLNVFADMLQLLF